MKPTANYRMSKSLKASLALSHFKTEEQRAQWKRAMIGAELAASVQPRTKQDRKKV